MILFTDQTANASSSSSIWYGGSGYFQVVGEWDTATMTLESSFDSVNWFPVEGDLTTMTYDGYERFSLPAGCKIRATLSSVGGETSLTATVVGP